MCKNIEQLCLDVVDGRVDLVNEELFVVSGVVNVPMISEFHECSSHLERDEKQGDKTAD